MAGLLVALLALPLVLLCLGMLWIIVTVVKD